MKNWWLVAGIAAFLFCSPRFSAGDIPDGLRPTMPATEAISGAARIADPEERLRTMRSAIREGLFAPNPLVRDGVFRYLSENTRWIDLRPYVDLLEEFGRVDHWANRGPSLADDVELFRAPRDERVRVYRTAILEGTAKLRRGTPLPRQVAIDLACFEGMAELKGEIETYYSETPTEYRQTTPRVVLMLRLELGAGAVDREEAARLACEHLAAMSDSDFREQMETNAAFSRVVQDVASYACAVDIIVPRRNPGCSAIKDVVARQRRLENAPAKPIQERDDTALSANPTRPAECWLSQLNSVSQGEVPRFATQR
jgi:hypothetical protein